MGRAPGLAADDVLVAVTTLSFDIAGLELYLPLITGARVVIAPATDRRRRHALCRSCSSDTEATIMQATPDDLADAARRPAGEPAGALKGTVRRRSPAGRARRQLLEAGVELWNMYGPTETTIWSTCSRIETRAKSLTIGRPIANTDALRPRRATAAGAGRRGRASCASAATGWRAATAAARISPRAVRRRPVRHDARSADLPHRRPRAATAPTATIEFLGRIDNQVKVRGFRIELGRDRDRTRRPSAVSAAPSSSPVGGR